MTTKKQVFYSFHYKQDNWRASQIRNIGAVEGNKPVSDNDWEEIKNGGDKAIQEWIDSQLNYKSCTIVLVGEKTVGRKWIDYEIKKSWNSGKGLVGIYIHGLKDKDGYISNKGNNPFEKFTVSGEKLSNIVKCYNPQGTCSQDRYDWISKNLSNIVEEAVEIRQDKDED